MNQYGDEDTTLTVVDGAAGDLLNNATDVMKSIDGGELHDCRYRWNASG